jgi:hypothetical protein
MNPEYPYGSKKTEKEAQMIAPPVSRLTDEKISDESDSENNSDSALRPAGLSNPFWK